MESISVWRSLLVNSLTTQLRSLLHDLEAGSAVIARQLARTGKELSRGPGPLAVDRLLAHYRWQRRYDPHNLLTVEGRSHRPHRRRQPTWSPALAERVLALRRQRRRLLIMGNSCHCV